MTEMRKRKGRCLGHGKKKRKAKGMEGKGSELEEAKVKRKSSK